MGVVLMLSVSMYDYHRFKDRTTLIFAGFILLLIYTRLFGRYVNGAKSWIGVGEFGIQISE
ncbi:FtsW/RodA/SpoVE family cell cycle protein, partial [Treponema paraluiscuniculi]